MIRCEICQRNIPKVKLIKHTLRCEQQRKKEEEKKVKDGDLFTRAQRAGLNYCIKKSKVFSKGIMHNLVQRFIEKGHTIHEIKAVASYIWHTAPLIIHFKVAHLDHFIQDTHYRNTFEITKTRSDSYRVWREKK